MEYFKEKLLYSRLEHKDREAFGQIYDKYVDQIYRFIFFKIGNKEEAEDLTSAVFLKLWNVATDTGFNEGKSLKPLLYKIARNTIIDNYRKKSKEENNISLDGVDGAPEILDVKSDPVKDFELTSDLDLLRDKMKELKDDYREVIIMKYIDGLTTGEIAEAMDKSNGNVRIMAMRAVNALRELLKKK